MGATTTQGTGPGSVSKMVKGNGHMNLEVSRLVGPKIVAAGRIALDGDKGYVYIPAPIGTVHDYVVILTNNGPERAYVSNPLAMVATSNQWAFQVAAGSNDTVNYMVVKIGLA